MKHGLMLFILLCGAVLAGNLLNNGDFEQDLTVGWTLDSLIGSALDTVDRAIEFEPDPDNEVRLKKFDKAHIFLHQSLSVPTTDLDFSVNAKLYALEENILEVYWAAAGIFIEYLDLNDSLLGQTIICYKTMHCIWYDTDTRHHITTVDTMNWNAYAFNLNDELVNLPGVNPAQIAGLRVALFDTTNGC